MPAFSPATLGRQRGRHITRVLEIHARQRRNSPAPPKRFCGPSEPAARPADGNAAPEPGRPSASARRAPAEGRPCRGLRPPGPPRPPRRRPRGPAGPPGPEPRSRAPRAGRVGAAPPRPARALRARPTHRRRPRPLAPSPSRCRKCRPRGRSAPRGRSRILAEWPSMVPSPPEKTVLRFLPSFRVHLPSLERRRVASRERRACGYLPL